MIVWPRGSRTGTAVDETTNTSVEAPSDSRDDSASDDKAGSDAELGTTRDNPAPLSSAISGATIDSTGGSTLFLAENEFDSLKTVYQGASVKGDQLLEVPADTWRDGVLAVSPGLLSDDTFVAVQ